MPDIVVDSIGRNFRSCSGHATWSVVETLRLQTLSQSSVIRNLLECEAVDVAGIPGNAKRIESPGRLPPLLERVVLAGEKRGAEWVAFERGWDIWLLTGEFVLDLAREYGRPVVRVQRYDAGGRVQESFNLIERHQSAWNRLSQ